MASLLTGEGTVDLQRESTKHYGPIHFDPLFLIQNKVMENSLFSGLIELFLLMTLLDTAS